MAALLMSRLMNPCRHGDCDQWGSKKALSMLQRLLLPGAFQACTQGLHLIGVGACAAQHYHPLPIMLSNTLKACCCRLCWQASTP